ncbi:MULTISPECIES: hypothetical protein [Microbacterium]|nr:MULTISPECIES: hypothetical protein [Microbacterium]
MISSRDADAAPSPGLPAAADADLLAINGRHFAIGDTAPLGRGNA